MPILSSMCQLRFADGREAHHGAARLNEAADAVDATAMAAPECQLQSASGHEEGAGPCIAVWDSPIGSIYRTVQRLEFVLSTSPVRASAGA